MTIQIQMAAGRGLPQHVVDRILSFGSRSQNQRPAETRFFHFLRPHAVPGDMFGSVFRPDEITDHLVLNYTEIHRARQDFLISAIRLGGRQTRFLPEETGEFTGDLDGVDDLLDASMVPPNLCPATTPSSMVGS
jgi:hypothetical protein